MNELRVGVPSLPVGTSFVSIKSALSSWVQALRDLHTTKLEMEFRLLTVQLNLPQALSAGRQLINIQLILQPFVKRTTF
jgi:hypothetical protein